MSNKLRKGYRSALYYVVYNGPPNTIDCEYCGDLETEYGLMEAVKVCEQLYQYIINPSEQITIAHIEYHGTFYVSKDLEITKSIAMAIVKNDHTKFKQYSDMFDENDVICMVKFNPDILGHVKNQTYDMCLNAMKIKSAKSKHELFTELFYGGVGLWHENINASFVEKFNLECFTEEEIIKLYEIMFKYNNNSIKYMKSRYITMEMLHKYINLHPEFLKQYIQDFSEHKLSEDDLKMLYAQMLRNRPYNFEHVDPNYQTPEMICMLKNDKYGVGEYQYIRNIEEIGEKIYNEAFEKNPNNIRHIPDKYKTFDMCQIAVCHNISNIMYVLKKFQTLQMCRTVGTKDFSLIEYCEYIDMDMLQSVHKQRINVAKKDRFDFINNLDDAKIIKVLKIMPWLLRIIAKHKLTDIMIKVALETDGYVLQYVDNQTDEYIDIALKNQPKAKKYLK